jgi:5-methylcytosine-specific restriction endonuclease McrA
MGNNAQTALTATERLRIKCTLSVWTGEAGACQWCAAGLVAGGRRKTWCSDKCRRAWERNHIWRRARAAARRRGKYECARCGLHKTEADIEVNHIVPVVGAGYGMSCSHHSSNLEVLCHDCHVAETNRQRKDGLFKK